MMNMEFRRLGCRVSFTDTKWGSEKALAPKNKTPEPSPRPVFFSTSSNYTAKLSGASCKVCASKFSAGLGFEIFGRCFLGESVSCL
jgi:hypothetical protein